MARMKLADTDPKYRVPLKGRYNAACTCCFHCDARFLDQDYHKVLIGVSEWRGDAVLVYECQKCFEFSFHHLDPGHYRSAVILWKNK